MATYACSDLHGMMPLYHKICDFLKPSDRVYFLGDANDKGTDGWKLIKEIFLNQQWIYMKGNHEDMLVHAMRQCLIGDMGDRYKNPIQLLAYNGGMNTLDDWIEEGMNSGWTHTLANLPTYLDYINSNGERVHLSHAGFTPPKVASEYGLLWERYHMSSGWPEDDNSIVVHGHTPIMYVQEAIKQGASANKILTYCNGHKVDIDLCSPITMRTCLLDLDTFDVHYFDF